MAELNCHSGNRQQDVLEIFCIPEKGLLPALDIEPCKLVPPLHWGILLMNQPCSYSLSFVLELELELELDPWSLSALIFNHQATLAINLNTHSYLCMT